MTCSPDLFGRLKINGIDYLVPGYTSHEIIPASQRPVDPDLSHCPSDTGARTWEVAASLSVVNGCSNGCNAVDGIYVRRFAGSYSAFGWTISRGSANAPCDTKDGFIYHWNGQHVFSYSPVGVFSCSIAWVRSIPASAPGSPGGWLSFSKTGGCNYAPDYPLANSYNSEPPCARWPLGENRPSPASYLLAIQTAFGERLATFSALPSVVFIKCDGKTPNPPNGLIVPGIPFPEDNRSPLRNPNAPTQPPWDPTQPPPKPAPPKLKDPTQPPPQPDPPPDDDKQCCCPPLLSISNNIIWSLKQ